MGHNPLSGPKKMLYSLYREKSCCVERMPGDVGLSQPSHWFLLEGNHLPGTTSSLPTPLIGLRLLSSEATLKDIMPPSPPSLT